MAKLSQLPEDNTHGLSLAELDLSLMEERRAWLF